MIESEQIQKVESLTKAEKNEPECWLDMKDLKQALDEHSKKVQQNLVAAQRQIADNVCYKNGVPPKQLLLYLVR